MSVLIWIAAPLIGLTLAMFGAGGGMTTVPILHYGLGLSMKEAIASSLWIVAGVSLVSLWQLNVWKELNIRLLSWFAAGGVFGSWLGTRIGLNISDMLQSMIFGVLTCVVAWWMLKPKPSEQAREQNKCQCARTLLVGIVLGVVTGVLGVGGGFLMVPALLWLGIVKYRLAVAHSLLLIIINASVAGVGYLGHVAIDLQPLLIVILLAVVGVLFGNWLCKKWPVKHMQKLFSLLLLCIGGFMLINAVRMM